MGGRIYLRSILVATAVALLLLGLAPQAPGKNAGVSDSSWFLL
jgi:hypothetical protein